MAATQTLYRPRREWRQGFVDRESAAFLEEFSGLILASGRTYQDIAEAVGVSTNTVWRYASTPPHNPRFARQVLAELGYRMVIVPVAEKVN